MLTCVSHFTLAAHSPARPSVAGPAAGGKSERYVDRLRKRGRKPAGDGHGQVVPVRIDATLLAALAERAERDHVSRSEAIRAAIRAYVA
jgi:hypothetical protein